MNAVNVHLNFLVNHKNLHRPSFIKQTIWLKSQGQLICKLIILSQTGIGKNVAKPSAKGFGKTLIV